MSSEWSRQIAREVALAAERSRRDAAASEPSRQSRPKPVQTAAEPEPVIVPSEETVADRAEDATAKELFEAELEAQGVELTHLPEPTPGETEKPAAPDVDPENRPVLMEMRNITLRFGGVTAIRDISFDIRQGEIRAIIGPNGAGKSSMLNVINGFYHPQEGEIWFKGKKRGPMRPHQIAHQGIARTFQNIALFKGMSTLDNIMTGRFTHMKQGIFSQAVWAGAAEREENENREIVEKIIDFLEIQHIRKKPVGSLPYGLQKRVELGRALAAEPGLLLLDEPMAGMNIEEKEDMSRFILDVNDEFGTTIALIEHDMGVVMDISDRVVVLDYGRKIGDGTPDEVRVNEDVIDAYLGVAHE